MSRANKKQVVKILQPLDIAILNGLYEYRALSTEQIMRRYEMSRWYTYKKLASLAKFQIDQHTSNQGLPSESEETRLLSSNQ